MQLTINRCFNFWQKKLVVSGKQNAKSDLKPKPYNKWLRIMWANSKIKRLTKGSAELEKERKVLLVHRRLLEVVFLFEFLFLCFSAARKDEVAGIRAKFPNKIPVSSDQLIKGLH